MIKPVKRININKKNISPQSEPHTAKLSGFAPFKHGKKNNFSDYFSARFWDSHFFVYKEIFSMNFPKNASQQQKGIV